MDPDATRLRFLDGLANAAAVDREVLDRPGITVAGRDDRAGTDALFCYRIDGHLLVWADPAMVDRIGRVGLVDGSVPAADDGELRRLADEAGFDPTATVVSNLLAGPPVPPGPPPVGADDGGHRRLRCGDPGVLDAVRAFTERCDPDDVESAALDELDDFDEAAINVVVASDDAEGAEGIEAPIVAWASASAWDWDPVFADIGVLVRADHRNRGLARFLVANTVADLLADGRLPLYRHEADNTGSAAVAASLGFLPVVTLDYFVSRPAGG